MFSQRHPLNVWSCIFIITTVLLNTRLTSKIIYYDRSACCIIKYLPLYLCIVPACTYVRYVAPIFYISKLFYRNYTQTYTYMHINCHESLMEKKKFWIPYGSNILHKIIFIFLLHDVFCQQLCRRYRRRRVTYLCIISGKSTFRGKINLCTTTNDKEEYIEWISKLICYYGNDHYTYRFYIIAFYRFYIETLYNVPSRKGFCKERNIII